MFWTCLSRQKINFVVTALLVDVQNSLNELVSILVVTLKSQEFPNIVECISVVWIALHEVKHLLNIIAVLYWVILLLQHFVLLRCLESHSVTRNIHLKFLDNWYKIFDTWSQYWFLLSQLGHCLHISLISFVHLRLHFWLFSHVFEIFGELFLVSELALVYLEEVVWLLLLLVVDCVCLSLFSKLLLQNLLEFLNLVFLFVFVLVLLLLWLFLVLWFLLGNLHCWLWLRFLLHFLLLLFAALLVESRKHVHSLLRQLVLNLVLFRLRLIFFLFLLHRQDLLSLA